MIERTWHREWEHTRKGALSSSFQKKRAAHLLAALSFDGEALSNLCSLSSVFLVLSSQFFVDFPQFLAIRAVWVGTERRTQTNFMVLRLRLLRHSHTPRREREFAGGAIVLWMSKPLRDSIQNVPYRTLPKTSFRMFSISVHDKSVAVPRIPKHANAREARRHHGIVSTAPHHPSRRSRGICWSGEN